MKLNLLILAVLALVAYASAAYYQLVPLHSHVDESEETSGYGHLIDRLRDQPRLNRQKRFTCDLLSFTARGVGGFNHAACAAKCLSQRHWGGYCDGTDCKCVSKMW